MKGIGLAVNLWRATSIVLAKPGCLGIPMKTFWPTMLLYVNQFLYWNLHMMTMNRQLVLCLLQNLVILFGSPSYMYTFEEDLVVLDLHFTPKMAFNFIYFSLNSLISLLFPLPSNWECPITVHPLIHKNYLFYFHF